MTVQLPGGHVPSWVMAEEAAFTRFPNEEFSGRKVWLHLKRFRSPRAPREPLLSIPDTGLRARARPSQPSQTSG